MPRLPEAYAVWMGRLRTPAECQATYAVDEVHYVDELAAVLQGLGAPCLHVLTGTNTDRCAMYTLPSPLQLMEVIASQLYSQLTHALRQSGSRDLMFVQVQVIGVVDDARCA